MVEKQKTRRLAGGAEIIGHKEIEGNALTLSQWRNDRSGHAGAGPSNDATNAEKSRRND